MPRQQTPHPDKRCSFARRVTKTHQFFPRVGIEFRRNTTKKQSLRLRREVQAMIRLRKIEGLYSKMIARDEQCASNGIPDSEGEDPIQLGQHFQTLVSVKLKNDFGIGVRLK